MATKKPKLTPTQAKVVKAKIKAELLDKPMLEVAQEVFPNSKPESARVMVQRELQKVTVQDALQEAFTKYGLTADTLVAGVASAAGAYKTVAVEGDLIETQVPDHSIRLKAFGMAAQWMGVNKQNENPTTMNFINIATEQKSKYDI